MGDKLRYDGRVVLVTGAGGGKCQTLLLACSLQLTGKLMSVMTFYDKLVLHNMFISILHCQITIQ